MGMLKVVYIKFRALIQFIERMDEEFLEGEVEDRPQPRQQN